MYYLFNIQFSQLTQAQISSSVITRCLQYGVTALVAVCAISAMIVEEVVA